MNLRRTLLLLALSSVGMVTLSHTADPTVTDSANATAVSESIVITDVLMTEG